MINVKKFTFENGCGKFKVAMPANAVVINAGDGCFWAIIDSADKQDGVIVNRVFYSVATDKDIDLNEPEQEEEHHWGINYVGTWGEYHFFEFIPLGEGGFDIPVEQA